MLVVQADPFNGSAISTFICAAITSNLRLAGAPGNVRVSPRESGLPKASVVNVSQVLTVDRSFLIERVQTLSSRTMQEVDEVLRLAMGL
jgi:mRNA interferase MazF